MPGPAMGRPLIASTSTASRPVRDRRFAAFVTATMRVAGDHAGQMHTRPAGGCGHPDHACQAMLYPINADCQGKFLPHMRISTGLTAADTNRSCGPPGADYRRGQLAFDAAPPRWVWAHTPRVQLAGAVRVALRAEPMGRVVASACGATLLGGCWQTVLVRSFDDVSADNRARSDKTRPRVALATAMV